MGCGRNRGNLVDGGMVLVLLLVLGQDASGDRQDVVRGSSGCRQGIDLVAGACSVISGVIVNPASIYWLRIGSVNSFPFVRSGGGGGGCDDMRHRYAPPICATDMRHRYGATICATDMVRRYARPENRKGQERIALGPDVVYFCDSLLYFCCFIHLIIFPISVGTIPAMKSSSCTSPIWETSVSHS